MFGIVKHIKAPFGGIDGGISREQTSLQINLRSLCMQTMVPSNDVPDPAELEVLPTLRNSLLTNLYIVNMYVVSSTLEPATFLIRILIIKVRFVVVR